MSFDVAYISSATNQTTCAAHWGKNGLICYSSCSAVLIYDLKDGGKVVDTLAGHKKRVNAVRWITGGDHETELVSASTDNTVIVWSRSTEEYVANILDGHKGIVNVVEGFYKDVELKHAIVISASDDSDIIVWSRPNVNDNFEILYNLNLGYSICMTLRSVMLGDDKTIVLACSLENSKIDIFCEQDEKLEKALTLYEQKDWVRGLDFTFDCDDNIIMASSSQDGTVNIWKFKQERHMSLEEIDKEKHKKLHTAHGVYYIAVEASLLGHEGWIYSVNWSLDSTKLLSVSIDKNMIIWEYDDIAEMWLESTRLGEVGGNTLGFYGGMFSADGQSIMAHGYHGAFHIWSFNEEICMWEPQVTVGGHFNEVIDLAWDPLGYYVMSASYDQTTRIHAPWKKNETSEITWHEIARPQVHGYDLSCLAVLNRYKFASGAEEKIVRTFQAPNNFIQNFRQICNLVPDDVKYDAPKGASVPSLGLSNKAVFVNDNAEQAAPKSKKDPYPEESHFTAVDLTEPPTEETLLQNTLWPEVRKLYGHGYEVYSLDASSDGKLIASACKSTTAEHAAIILWDAESWNIKQKLQSHTLTVAQIAFSPDCENILSVSRDRRWSLFTRSADTGLFQLVATTNKAVGIHTRIIWCCAWSHDSKYFATGSRDGKVVVWKKNVDKPKENILGQYEAASAILNLKSESVTALAFAMCCVGDNYIIAVGVEKGFIYLYKWSKEGFQEILHLNNRFAHHLTVKRLRFRPVLGQAGYAEDTKNKTMQLASCGSDHSVRIYNINVI